MSTIRFTAGLAYGLVVLWAGPSMAQPAAATSTGYGDPTRFEQDIEGFEALDLRQPPPPGAVLCVGSSTMRMWHQQIHDDLAPLTIVARGFGGSTMHDLLFYTDRIVLPYRPRAIVVYEGDNDVWKGVGAVEIRDTFRKFVSKVHGRLPKTRIYFLAIKPSYKRRSKWSTMVETNRLIAQECVGDERLRYVDIVPVLLDANGQVRRELFTADELHLNRAGYERVREVLRPVLMKDELAHEADE